MVVFKPKLRGNGTLLSMATMTDGHNPEFQIPSDWRGKVITKIRALIQEADPEIVEEVKWKTASNPNGVLAWYKDGLISTGEVYQKHLRLSFAKGPALKDHDPKGLINTYRAMVIKEEESKIDEEAFVALIRAAVALNQKK